MDSYAKMRRSNAKAKAWMLQNNFNDIHFFPHNRFIKDLHFQGLEFDGLASWKDYVVLFQVKSNLKPTKKLLQQYEDVEDRFKIICLWINVVDRKGIEVNNEKYY